MKKQTTNLSLGSKVREIIADVAKTRHGKNIKSMIDALHSPEHCKWMIIVTPSKAKQVNASGYKRYHIEPIKLKDGSLVCSSTQFTHDGFKKFTKHVKVLSLTKTK